MKTDEIRERFLKFFKARDHKIVSSDSLIPAKDPTLLFTGAGMNQFKDYFLGLKKDIKRAASSQKCLRTGDLERVGFTAYHHSFFEMLGNFSFGDYFKREAILWAYEFMTKELAIPGERLHASVHEKDEEAYKIWRDEIGMPDRRIYRFGDKTNFWPSNAPADGPNGPCGPCSEIFYDQGEGVGCGKKTCNVECDCGRYAEVWNLVFTQFDREDAGKLTPLEAKNIDTGMGLERIACVMQGKRNNFETDIFDPLVQHLKGLLKKSPAADEKRMIYVIADHTRAAVFSIADGAIPSNEGRGYVVRKLIRRAAMYAKKMGSGEPVLYTLVPIIEKLMGKTYPELVNAGPHISEVLKQEEERFLDRLEEGLRMLKDEAKRSKQNNMDTIPAEVVFYLHDTCGLPIEITTEVARELGMKINSKECEALMDEQRKRARENTQIAGAIFVTEEMDRKLHGIPATKFVGYETNDAEATVLAVIDGKWAVLDRTSLYAESGGQVGDTGMISGEGFKLEVTDVKKRDTHFLHKIENMSSKLRVGCKVRVSIDSQRRLDIMRNHTATHLLQAALRNILGKGVRQLGSLVAPDRLRFDFSYGKALTPGEIEKIEKEVNGNILKNSALRVSEKTTEEAKREGALAFFGEKYGERVRLVEIENTSKELCGGTHAAKTGDIGCFIIVSESSVASGVRRIEAVTGRGALEHIQKSRTALDEIASLLKVKPEDAATRVKKLMSRTKELERGAKASQISVEDLRKLSSKLDGYNLICGSFKGATIDELRDASDEIRHKEAKTVIVLFGITEDKAHFIVACSPDAVKKISANDIIRDIAKTVEGQGGGRKDLAQGGTKRLDLTEKVLSRIADIVRKHLS
ncbi:MAG: alanine--tRNA ligase [Candidatus Omnitrophica bacterium]|nr:alanine--tRNA ligase [Candidatus Omnitrophota bacterium]